jgi:hypothetical protein
MLRTRTLLPDHHHVGIELKIREARNTARTERFDQIVNTTRADPQTHPSRATGAGAFSEPWPQRLGGVIPNSLD